MLSEITSEDTDSLSLSTGRTYDSAGRVETVTDARGLITTYTYENNGLKKTVTHPGGFTKITENYIGGQVKSITGTAVVHQYYTYGVNTDGTRWTKLSLGASDSVEFVSAWISYRKKIICAKTINGRQGDRKQEFIRYKPASDTD